MATQAQPQGSTNTLLLASAAGVGVSLVVVFFNLMRDGHATFNTTSDGVSWGLPVATYVFFVLTSTGLTFVASLAMVFNLKDFYPIVKRCIWLAVAALVAGFAALALEVGHPFRMLWALPLSFQFRSPMHWMGVLYAAYLVLLLLKFQKVQTGDWDSAVSRSLGIASFGMVVLAHGTLGAVFGMMAMRPLWYDPIMPFYFLLTAALSGAAFAVLITHIAHGRLAAMPEQLRALLSGPLASAFATVLGLTLIATIARTVTGLWSNADGLQVWDHVVASPWFWAELIGLVIAFAILIAPKLRARGGMQLLAAVLVIAALFIGRYEYVIGGQLVPLFKGAWAPAIIPYTPSLSEWMLALLALSLTFAVYAVGERRFDLSAQPPE